MRFAAALLMVTLSACSSTAPGGPVASPTGAAPVEAAPVESTTPQPGAPPTGATAEETSPEAPTTGPSEERLEQARRDVAAMPLEQAAGQVIVARYAGTDPEAAASLVRELDLAGVILMGDNVASVEQVRATSAAVQEAAAEGGRNWPAVVAVDQEGGTVVRVGAPATQFPTFMTLGAARDPELAARVARSSGEELRSLGFTMVFAPDADVTSGPDDPTIGSRSASDDPELVAQVVSGALRGYAEAGIVAVAKHFPGHGSVPADSHLTLPVQEAALATLFARDLVPFRAIAPTTPAVMVAHLDVTSLDPGAPTSLSPAAYELLRDDVGFGGLAVTDALDMAAVSGGRDPGEAAVQALAAGADMLLMPADARAARAAVVDAVTSGAVPRERLDEAAARLVALMRHPATQGPRAAAPGPSVIGMHDGVSYDASLAGLTVAQGPCSGALVGDGVQVVGGTQADRQRFEVAAADSGLSTAGGTSVRLLGGRDSSGTADVVVALDAPYGLGSSQAGTARIALYGRTPQAFRALVDVLLGDAIGAGRLPVAVDGLPAGAGC